MSGLPPLPAGRTAVGGASGGRFRWRKRSSRALLPSSPWNTAIGIVVLVAAAAFVFVRIRALSPPDADARLASEGFSSQRNGFALDHRGGMLCGQNRAEGLWIWRRSRRTREGCAGGIGNCFVVGGWTEKREKYGTLALKNDATRNCHTANPNMM